MATKAKPVSFWQRVRGTLGVLLRSRNFLAGAGLFFLALFFLVSANAMASRDDYFALGAHGEDTHVFFVLNNGKKFTAGSEELASFKPAWLPQRSFDQLLAVRNEVRGMRIWDSSLFDRLRTAIESSPASVWVEGIPVMTRRLPAFVTVSISIRAPYAEVAYGSSVHMVDRHGMLLPTEPGARPGSRLIRIDGITDPPPAPGQVWKSEWLSDALGLMRDLQSGLRKGTEVVSLLEEIIRIKCEKTTKGAGEVTKPVITLYHQDGCEIYWEFYTPGDRAFASPGNGIKLNNLRKMIFEGRIENIASVKSIDLSAEDPIVIFRGKK